MTAPKMFPIMDSTQRRRFDWAIPWAMMAPHEGQALRNHGQTLARLAERGGLGPDEALAALRGLRLGRLVLSEEEARAQLHQEWRAWEQRELVAEADALRQENKALRLKWNNTAMRAGRLFDALVRISCGYNNNPKTIAEEAILAWGKAYENERTPAGEPAKAVIE